MQVNRALYTDGEDDWISLGDMSNITCIANTNKCPTDGFQGVTVAFWFKLHSCNSWGGILSSYGYELWTWVWDSLH